MAVDSSNSKRTGIEGRRTPRRAFYRAMGMLRRGKYDVVQALQLSEGGMMLSTETKMRPKDRLVVTIVLPDGRGLVVSGEVIYEIPGAGKSANYGVKFLNLALAHRRMIRNYVSAKTQEEAELENEELDNASFH